MKAPKITPTDTAERPSDDQVPGDPDPAASADEDEEDPWALDPLSPPPVEPLSNSG